MYLKSHLLQILIQAWVTFECLLTFEKNYFSKNNIWFSNLLLYFAVTASSGNFSTVKHNMKNEIPDDAVTAKCSNKLLNQILFS